MNIYHANYGLLTLKECAAEMSIPAKMVHVDDRPKIPVMKWK